MLRVAKVGLAPCYDHHLNSSPLTGGGHTGEIPTSLLVPACVDAVKGAKSPLTGDPIYVLAAGGIYDGRGLATALVNGAVGVWVGTRFVASVEAGAPKAHKEAYVVLLASRL